MTLSAAGAFYAGLVEKKIYGTERKIVSGWWLFCERHEKRGRFCLWAGQHEEVLTAIASKFP